MPRISSTTWPAGPAELPDPSTSAPRSLTTILAPCEANSSACSRPMPRPPPVMTTTRPSQMPTLHSFLLVGLGCCSILIAQLPLEDLPRILARQLVGEVDR